MPLNANKIKSEGKGNRVEQEVLEAGAYKARLVQIIDLGLQPQRPFDGKEKEPAYKISITYELLDEFMVDEEGNELEDKPRWISEEINVFSLDADRAKSTQRYKAIDPDVEHGGDFSKLLGEPCMVTIVNNPGKGKNAGRTFANVSGISQMRAKDASKAPELVNAATFLDLDEPDLDVFEKLPDFMKDKITSNLEFKGSALDKILNGATDASGDSQDEEQ